MDETKWMTKNYINSDGGYRMTKEYWRMGIYNGLEWTPQESFGNCSELNIRKSVNYMLHCFALEAVKDKSKDC